MVCHMTFLHSYHRTMGDNLEEAEELDRIVHNVAEGTYHPSKSAMETFPVSCTLLQCACVCVADRREFSINFL